MLTAVQRTVDEFSFRDLQFKEVPVQCYSTAGSPYRKVLKVGMPKISKESLDCAVYLYPSVEAAKTGRGFGGTGFIVSYPSETLPDQIAYTYVISNWHVVCKDGASVVRVNMKNGEPDIFDLGPEDWEFDPRYDIAVASIPVNVETHRVKFVPLTGLVTRDNAERDELGPGDDVFMIGRFIDHDGGPTNKPALRFGNISVSGGLVMQPNGKRAETIIVDCHSRTGYSGSPVFVYRTPGSDLSDQLAKELKDQKVLFAGVNYLMLLGIHYGQFPEAWELEVENSELEKRADKESLITEGAHVKGYSGMTCVLPAQFIRDVLNMPKLAQQRKQMDEVIRQKNADQPAVPDAEGAKALGNPNHLEDFNRLLDAAVKGPKPSDET